MDYYEPRLPCDTTQICRFRRLLGEDGIEQLLKAAIETAVEIKAVKPADLEFVVGEAVGNVPIDAGRAGQRYELARQALGNLQRSGDFTVAQPCLQMQAQCISNSAHGDSVRGHRLVRKKAVSLSPGSRSHLHAPQASVITLKQRPRSV